MSGVSDGSGTINIKHPIILIHGAGHGGWCWRDVRRRLQAQGYEVFAPTLTGLGERVHLRSPEVTLNTHITDVSNLIEWEELHNVILVGHSYGGMVITGVCDRLKDRISHVVYLDAAVPVNGQPTFPGISKEGMEDRFGPLEDGYLIPITDLKMLGMADDNSEQTAWVRRRITDHLYGAWAEPIVLVNGGSEKMLRTYVSCTDPAILKPSDRLKIEKIKQDPSWNFIENRKPHNMMITDPVWTADLIAEKVPAEDMS